MSQNAHSQLTYAVYVCHALNLFVALRPCADSLEFAVCLRIPCSSGALRRPTAVPPLYLSLPAGYVFSPDRYL
eukprot:1993843-Pleurochrysis_carterae.AAC.1